MGIFKLTTFQSWLGLSCWSRMMRRIIRIYLGEVDINTIPFLGTQFIYIVSIADCIVLRKLSCSFFLLHFMNACWYRFHQAIDVHVEFVNSTHCLLSFYLMLPLYGLQLFKSSDKIIDIPDTEGEFHIQPVELSDNRLVKFSSCWAHCIRWNTVNDASD